MDAVDLAAVRARLDATPPYDDEAFTGTVVTGSTVAAVLEAFGGLPDEVPTHDGPTWEYDLPAVARPPD